MWKKILIGIVALVGTFSIAYAYNMEMKANNSLYAVGNDLTGRINIAPSGINGSHIGMQKGDRIYLGVKNTNSDDDNLGFQLIYYDTNYTDYLSDVSGATVDPAISAWYSFSTESLGKSEIIDPSLLDTLFTQPLNGWSSNSFLFKDTPIYLAFTDINNKLSNSSNSKLLIAPRNLSYNRAYYDYANSHSYKFTTTIHAEEYINEWRGQKVFPVTSTDVADRLSSTEPNGIKIPLSPSDLSYSGSYHLYEGIRYVGGGDSSNWLLYMKADGSSEAYDRNHTGKYEHRAATYIDTTNIVFALSEGTGATYAKINKPELNSSAVYQSVGKKMKVRLYNSALNVNLNDLKNKEQQSINKIVKGGKVNLDITANVYKESIISAMIFKDNEFIYYIPLETAKNGMIECDLSMLGEGKYKIAVVNEVFDSTSLVPAESSYISATKDIEIVEGHTITYTKEPQPNAIEGDYEYDKNVDGGQKVGTISLNPTGVTPIKYELASFGDATFENFEISGLDADGKSSSTSLDVKIKSDAKNLVSSTNSLKAGDYKFCIISTDANGDPGTPTDKTRVCKTFTVKKTATAIGFNDKTTTKKSIIDASTKWSEIAKATPPTGTKITYSVASGDVGLIDIDPDSGEITYKGNGSFGSVKIKATVDDDPSTGNDSYEPSSTEKEIIIFKEVGGYVKPDSQSSSITDPTFTAADKNIKSGGTIGMIIGEDGTPDTIGGNTTSYTYDLDKTSANANFFTVDKSTGKITTTANLSTGTYNIVVTVSDKWSTKNIPVIINVGMSAAEDLKFYEDSAASKSITKKNVSFTDKNVVVFATVKGSSNNQKVKYYIKDNSTNVITVNENTGAVEIKGVGKVTVVAKKAGVTGQAEAVSELEFEVTSGSFIFKYVDDAGQELNKAGDKYNAYKEIFAKDKKFQVYTNKAPDGITVTYELKDQSAAMSDVISVDSTTGEVTIINASKTNQMGKIVIIATAHDPSGTYSDQSIELPIIIEKGTRVVSFADDPIYVASGKGSITPVIHVDGIPETEGKANISIEDNSADGIVWTDDTKTIEYEYSKEEAKEIQLKVTLPADRNYNIAEASGTLHIMGANDNALTISTPGKIMYGDNFTIKSTQDDEGSTNVQYTFEVDDTTYISAPTITGKEAVFDALKATGTNTVTVTVTRTADGELPSSKKVNIKVLPKPIEIIIDHKEKLKGEPNPTLTYQDFNKQLVSWNGTQDVIQANDIKLSTTAKATSEANDYPIKGDSSTLNKTYPNYIFTFKENTLTITEENIEDEWYHLELDDGKNTTYKGTWTNQDVNIISDHTDYKHISKDQSTWETPQVTVSTEGKTEQSFWMKKDTGATTSEKKETILIDKSAPTIKTITATDTNNKLQNIINQLTGGIFFKPGTQFEITTSDTKDELDVSGTNSIEYKIYKQNDDKSYGSPMKQDTLTVTNEKAKVTISDTTGTYKICVLPKDKAGNAAEEETCKEITLKKINVDIDGDGNDDFNDSDGDGCPDLNIVLGKDSDGEWIKLNIDTNNDNLPDLNIDTNGDGIADINVDQDGDGIPDLNIVKVTAWNPTVCVTGQAEEYCTDGTIIPNINVDLTGDGRPDINIDLNNDGIPDIDIDTDGDGKPDINIDTNKDGTADENLKKMSEWKIDAEVFEVKNVKFQTMKGLVKDTLDQLEDNGIILEPGEGSVILPNYAIKVTEVEDDKIKQTINQVSEDQEVKKIYDVKFLKDNVETQPDGTMKIKIPVPEGVKNPQLVVQRTDGTYEKLNCILENGYLVYETKEVGIVSVLGDKDVIDNTDPEPTPQEPTPEPEQPKSPVDQKGEEPVIDTPKPTVQGAYTSDANYTLGNNMGGVSTGDSTTMIALVGMLLSSLIILLYSRHSILHKK